jgi:nucleoside triphosphate diphosphatase
VNSEHSESDAFQRLCEIMARLRSANGCPWDAQQTPDTLKPFIIEEAYELLEAIDQGDSSSIKEELGDLLLQIIFQAQIHQEQSLFTIQDVILGISNKLIRRHPHVFATPDATHYEHHELRWEQIKADEKAQAGLQHGLISNIPKQLPALQAAQKIYSKLSRHGHAKEAIINSGSADQSETDPAQALESETQIGRMAFQLAIEAQHQGINAEDALRKFNLRIQDRFRDQSHLQTD